MSKLASKNKVKAWTNRTKVAALLLLLEPESSSRILKHIGDDQEVAAIVKEITMIDSLTEEEQLQILDEIYDTLELNSNVAVGTIDAAQSMLIGAYGEDGAHEIMERMVSTVQRIPFEFLRLVDAEQIANTIQNEHIQVIALVLSCLKIEKAAQVLQALPEHIRSEVAVRLAKMERTNPEVLSEVERILERRFASIMASSDIGSEIGGTEALAEILNRVDRNTEKRILEDLEKVDQGLATDIRNLMFVFEDIIKLDDKSIQRLLREIDSKDLSLALKGSSDDIRLLFFKNMAQRAAKLLQDDIEMMGPVRMRDVSEVQSKIVSIVRTLEQAGEVFISGGSAEDALIE